MLIDKIKSFQVSEWYIYVHVNALNQSR